METSNRAPLFSWLTCTTEKTLCWGKHTVTRYCEAAPDIHGYCYRLILSPLADKVACESAIAKVDGNLGIAPLTRDSAYLGFEITVQQPLSDVIIMALSDIAHSELFVINKPLPRFDWPGLLVMDMDSTAIEIECIDELASLAGVGEAVAEVTEMAMQGELDFEQSLRQRVAKLAGASEHLITQLCQQLPLTPGLTHSVNQLQQQGWRLVVASGGFTPFVGQLKRMLGLDAAYANELVIVDGELTGEVTGEVVDANFKAKVVHRCGEQWQIPLAQRVAIGDGANDIPMLSAAGFGIAYHAKPKLKAYADISIDQLDLHLLPFLMRKGSQGDAN